MGGVLILFALTISTLLWVDLHNYYVWPVLFVTLGYGALGFADDYLKLSRRNTRGVSGPDQAHRADRDRPDRGRLDHAAHARAARPPDSSIPVLKEVLIPLGLFFPVFAMLVMLGSSNAVNLTDGLDGLAIVPTIIAAGVFALIAYLVGNRIFADYLQLNPVPGSASLACSARR